MLKQTHLSKIMDQGKEETDYFRLMNVFLVYYKHRYNGNDGSKKNLHLFTGVDYTEEQSTTKCMELLYEEMYKFNDATDEEKTVYEPEHHNKLDINKCKELYVVIINDEYSVASPTLIPVLSYVTSTDWTKSKWFIYQLK